MRRNLNRMLVTVCGGPGAGKTTVLDELSRRGFAVMPDTARAIITERLSKGMTPRPTPEEFAETILLRDREHYQSVAQAEEIVFFDRSVVDAVGMLVGLGVISDERRADLLDHYRYHPTAFIFPPWKDIYRTDAERDQSFDESVRVYQSVKRWYSLCGYDLTEIPPASVEERCEVVLGNLRES